MKELCRPYDGSQQIVATILAFALQTRSGLLSLSERRQSRDYQRISKLWRATSLSTPCLWRGIHIGQDDFAQLRPWYGQEVEIRQRFAKYLTSWFSHAGLGARLHLAVSPIFGLKVAHILEIIQESTFCISSLALEAGKNGHHFRQYADLAVLSNRPNSYPALDSLTLSFPIRLNISGEGSHTFNLTQSFPGLCVLTLNDGTGRTIPVNFAHQTLQHLHLNSFTYSPLQFSRLLQSLPNLEALQVYKCATAVGANLDGVEIPPYYHQKLHSITFAHSVPVEWFKALTCPSVKVVRIEGDFGSRDDYSDAGKRLSELIINFLPSDLTVIGFAVHQGPMLRQLLRNSSSISALAMRCFSDLNPLHFVDKHEAKDDLGIPLHPFLIPTSLKYIRCWEKGAESTFCSWAEDLQRYLRFDQELEVEAPRCYEGTCLLKHFIPADEVPGSLMLFHNYMYHEFAVCRGDKFTFYFYPKKLPAVPRSRRLAGARLAFRRHAVRMSVKVELRGVRRQAKDHGLPDTFGYRTTCNAILYYIQNLYSSPVVFL
ncbi:hypothetical protein BKA70DRAFT_1482661 [Coprinopsis sp. MPI-PUGE-AT-0042]|nr:hypothetical protein BKA70DRAFT_1482661 [Coprinopsis sp. MPI-PUGE-AT-0042]